MKQTGKVALGGVLGALSVVLLMGTVFPYATFALPVLAGLVLVPVAVEAGRGWGFFTFAAVALLNLLLTPSMESKILFVAFLGYYPLLKLLLDPLPPWLSWLLKIALFNVTVVAAYWVMLRLFALEDNSFELFGVDMPPVILAVGNLAFVLVDICLSKLTAWYMWALHPRIKRLFRT